MSVEARAHEMERVHDAPAKSEAAQAHGAPSMPAGSAPPPTGSPDAVLNLQRTVGNRAVSELLAVRSTIAGLALPGDGGAPLPSHVREDMEDRFGTSFEDVRIHTNAAAVRATETIAANAYTIGNHVVFNDGRFAPQRSAGRRLLAHELAHVVQQRRGGPAAAADPLGAMERHAKAAARQAADGAAPVSVGGASGTGIAREAKDEKPSSRLDKLYQSALSSPWLPAPAKQALRDANTRLDATAQQIDPSGQLREHAKDVVVRAIGQHLDTAQKVLDTPTAPPRPDPKAPAPVNQAAAATPQPKPTPPPPQPVPQKPLTPEEAEAKADDETLAANGMTRQQLLDYDKMTRGDFIDKYGLRFWWNFRTNARALPGPLLYRVLPKEDQTLYLLPSGRIGTAAQERAERVQNLPPPPSATGLAAGGLMWLGTKGYETITGEEVDPRWVQGAMAVGDLVEIGASPLVQRGAMKSLNTGSGQRPSMTPPPSNVASPPESTPAPLSPKAATVAPPPVNVAPRLTFSEVPADVGDAAFRARMSRAVEFEMRANRRNTIGAGGEASARASATSTTVDLNEIKRNAPQLDIVSSSGAGTVKAFGMDRPNQAPSPAVTDRYLKEMAAIRTPIEPGVPTKLGKIADVMASNREAIQARGAWPTGLAKNASAEDIAKFINRQGELVIPRDHVEPVQRALEDSARKDPAAYGLTPGPGLDVGIARLKARVKSMGMSTQELHDLNQKVWSE